MKRFTVMIFVALAATFGLVACGDDDNEGDLAAYCDLVEELDAQEDFPTDEQLNELQDVAPAEIDDEVDLVAERFKEVNDNPEDAQAVFEDPEVEEAFSTIEAYEDENCPEPEPATETDDADVDDETDDEPTTTVEETDDEDTTTTVEDTTTTEDTTVDDDTTETTVVD